MTAQSMESLSVSQENFFSLSFFLLDIFFIYISNIIPFSSFPSKNPLSSPPAPQPTHSHFLALAFPYTGA